MRKRELDWSGIDDQVDDDYDEPHIPYDPRERTLCECGLAADEWWGGRWICDYCRATGGRGVDE